MGKKKDGAGNNAPERPTRDVALLIALRGVEEARRETSPDSIARAQKYLADLATADGRAALGGALLILQDTIERARDEGQPKIVIDGTARIAELVRLAEYAEVDTAERRANSEREKQAVAYLESTGLIEPGLDLVEAARLVAQEIIDKVLPTAEK